MITGTGSMKAAVAITYLCTLYPPQKSDIFMNTGVCGALQEDWQGLFLVHKITGAASGRSYYPDILYEHPFDEGEVTSFLEVQTKNTAKGQLADMEAEGLWHGASLFFAPDRMLFLVCFGFLRWGSSRAEEGADVEPAGSRYHYAMA